MIEMSVLFSLPALLKILLTFVALLLLNRLFPLYICLAAASLMIGMWMQMALSSILRVMLQEILSAPVLLLSLVISLIIVFSELLSRGGRLDRIVSSLKTISARPGVSLAVLPALIGMLPMPGGALFSAPLVEKSSGGFGVKPEQQLAINYWFRHVMEFAWPLYPGFILCISIFGLETWRLMAFQIPMTVGAIIAGVLFVLPALPLSHSGEGRGSRSGLHNFVRDTFPIALVIGLMFVLQGCAELTSRLCAKQVPLSQHLSMAAALVAGIVYLVRTNCMSHSDVKSVLLRPGMIPIVLLVFAIMAFKGILGESGAIDQVRAELQAFRIPEILVIALLPLIAGFVTGIAVGFVGSSFPLVVTLLPSGEAVIPYVILAYGFGFIGMMLSPLHLCFVVTQEYFHANALESYRRFWKAAIFMIVWLVLIFALYRTMV